MKWNTTFCFLFLYHSPQDLKFEWRESHGSDCYLLARKRWGLWLAILGKKHTIERYYIKLHWRGEISRMAERRAQHILSQKNNYKTGQIVKNNFETLETDERHAKKWEVFIQVNLLKLG